MRRSRWGSLMALLPLLCLFGDNATRAQNTPNRKINILFATVSANYRDGLTRLAREYERLHPNVSVQVQIQPANGYETWLRTQIGSNSTSAPDIYNFNYAIGFYERGLLVNLTPFLDQTNPYSKQPWRATLDPQFLEKFKIGGEVGMIPLDFIEIALFYNQDMFDRLGLKPPRTWEEMLRHAERIRQAGYIPFAVPGDADSYWSGTVGWVFRFVTDAYTREEIPNLMAQPGDWDYDSARNANFRLNVADPYNDSTVVMNAERLLLAVRDGKLRLDNERFREAYEKIREFASYWQPGFNGTNATSAYQLFLTRKAAMMLNASSAIAQMERDTNDLYPADRFRWGVFPIPPMTRSKFRLPPFRGVGGPGVSLGVVKKNPEQTRQVVDFMMYLTTPHAAQVLVEEAVKARQPINGPMLIPGATMPPIMEKHFAAFRGRGFEKLSFRGLSDEQESVWQWTVWAQRYLDGRISTEQCLDRYQRLMQEAVPRVCNTMHYDLNPRTKDSVKSP